MVLKTCFKCGETKPIDMFYKHRRMSDGYLNKCKECARRDVSASYVSNREHYLAYQQAWRKAPENRERKQTYTKRYQEKYPEKYRAHYKLNYAVRAGKIHPEPCIHCGNTKVHGHHRDYSKPLQVVWVCDKHHKEIEHSRGTR